MMVRCPDLNLSPPALAGNDSVREFLKQAMLQHEIDFRHQVRELHRLYWTQKSLMAEFGRRATVLAENVLSVPPSPRKVGLEQQRAINLRLPAEEHVRGFGTEFGKEGGNGFVCDEFAPRKYGQDGEGIARDCPLEKGCSLFGRNIRINLEKLVILDCDDSGSTRKRRDCNLEKLVILDCDDSGSTRKRGDCSAPMAVVNQSPAVVGHGGRLQDSAAASHGGVLRPAGPSLIVDLPTQKDQPASSKPLLIDLNLSLEDESSSTSNEPLPRIPSSPTSSSVVQHGTCKNSHTQNQTFMSFWRESNNKCSKETYVGLHPVASHLGSNYTTEQKTVGLFHVCESSHPSNPLGSTQSARSAEVIEHHDQHYVSNRVPNADAEVPKELQVGYPRECSCGFDCESQDNLNNKAPSASGLSELESKRAELQLEDQDCHGNSESRRQTSTVTSLDDVEEANLHVSAGSSNLPPTATADSQDKQPNCEESEEDTLSSHNTARGEKHQDTNSEGDLFVCENGLVGVDDECVPGDDQIEDYAVPSISEESGTTQTGLPASQNNPGKQVLIAENCDQGSLQIQFSNIGKLTHQDAPAKDLLILTAAETLIFISSEKPKCPAELLSGSGLIEMQAEASEKPQHPSDSFELLTLMLPESKIDEYSVPAVSSGKASASNACGIKLRRGRGLRDFQKEILPGLVSLSRHEICEDLHNMEHELRKSSSRTTESWPVPARCRRTRRCNANRRL